VSRPLVIAHRGASGHEVGNSLAAYRAAADRGADAVELDIHATADGALIVHHDERIGGRLIAHSNLHEVRGHRLANGEVVPTLEEALATIVPRMQACVEIKALAPRWDERLFEAIDRTGVPGRVAVLGFDHRVIHRLGEKRPFLHRGVVSASYPVHPVRCVEDADASALWQDRSCVDEALVSCIHDAGMALYVWTVNEPDEMPHFLALGVDGLCTDFPDLARTAVDSFLQ
jgi:glycerophosphoryl diester phosphodiesterase